MDDMALMYLAKINLTEGIFDVYDNKLKLDDVKQTIYDELNENASFSTSSNFKYRDSYGNVRRMPQLSKYSLIELKKLDDGIITGKLVRTFNKPTEKIDETGKLLQSSNEESVSIYFYLDSKREAIAFSERQSFGYNQFITAFAFILSKSTKKYKFEIFLQKDKGILEEKIRALKSIQSIKATLIPPNSNDEDLAEFRNSLRYMQDCRDANANKFKMEMSTTDENSLKIESKYVQDVYTAVSKGYGEVNTTGINHNGKRQTISSNQDAAFTRIIDDNLTEEEYNQESKSFIHEWLLKHFARANK